MTQWRANSAGHRLCGGHRRNHPHRNRRPLLSLFEYGGRHRENPRVTGGNDGHRATLLGQFAGQPGALGFVGVIGRVAALSRTDRHPVQIRAIADQVGGGGQLAQALRRHPFAHARAESDDRHGSGAWDGPGGAAVTRYDGHREVRDIALIDVGGRHDALTVAAGSLNVDRLIEAT